MKTCTRCEKSKLKSEFYNNKAMQDGLTIWCKDCVKSTKASYIATPKGKACKAWDGMNWRCGNDKHYVKNCVKVNVDKDEFIRWATPEYEKFMILYPLEIPSIDRIDSNGNYEMGNMRIISQRLNCRRSPFLTPKELVEKVEKLCNTNEVKIYDLLAELRDKHGIGQESQGRKEGRERSGTSRAST